MLREAPKGPGTVTILGAGPAGLAAGLALSRAGWAVDVYDQAPVVGGLARTLVQDGFRFDIGGHRWFTKNDALNHFLVELLGDELIMVDRVSRIFFDGKYMDYPLRAANVLSRIGPATSVRAIGDFVVSKATRAAAPTPILSMEDAYVAQFGRTLYELFFRRYSEKVWGGTCAEMSGDWVAQRSRGLSLFTAMRDALGRNSNKAESLIDHFMYPALGFGRIAERMAENIVDLGGHVHLGWRADRVQHERGRITGVRVTDGARERIVQAEAVISSIPMTELTQSLWPAPAPDLLLAADTLTHRALITAHLMLARPSVSDDTWLYVHDPRVSFARLHEPRNWSPRMAPAGRTSLVLELFCNVDDDIWRRADEDILDLVISDLTHKLGWIEPNEVIGGFVVRCRDAYPRYHLGYNGAVEAIKEHLGSFVNLSIVGRGGTFRYNNTDHAIETGLLAAARILGEHVDIEAVNRDKEYLEERRVALA